jgi:hypothetical protein
MQGQSKNTGTRKIEEGERMKAIRNLQQDSMVCSKKIVQKGREKMGSKVKMQNYFIAKFGKIFKIMI